MKQDTLTIDEFIAKLDEPRSLRRVGAGVHVYDSIITMDVETNNNSGELLCVAVDILKDGKHISSLAISSGEISRLFTALYNSKGTKHIFIHNLSFDNKFIRQYYEDLHDIEPETFFINKKENSVKVFTDPYKKKQRVKLYFHDTAKLFMSTLDAACKRFNVEYSKTSGWDYSLDRDYNVWTPSDDELKYIIHDVRGLSECVAAYIDMHKYAVSISAPEHAVHRFDNVLPTASSYVRRYAHKAMKTTKLKGGKLSGSDLSLLKQCQWGGLTGLTPALKNTLLGNVSVVDFVSSYTAVLTQEKFAVGDPITIINTEEFVDDNYISHGVIELHGVIINKNMPYAIPKHKVLESDGAKFVDSKLLYADRIVIAADSILLQAWRIIYDIGSVRVIKGLRYMKDYLPNELVEFLLNGYYIKGTSKDTVAKALAKLNINTVYGACATSPIKVNAEWTPAGIIEPDPDDISEYAAKYNKKLGRSRKLRFEWGLECASYGQARLCNALKLSDELNLSNVYVDTDSVFIQGGCSEAHKLVEAYNTQLASSLRPSYKDNYFVNGELLGAFSCETCEGKYPAITSFVAKRPKVYAGFSNNSPVKVAVAGLSKDVIIKELTRNGVGWFMSNFNITESKKLRAVYEFGYIKGNRSKYRVKLLPVEFSYSQNPKDDFLEGTIGESIEYLRNEYIL